MTKIRLWKFEHLPILSQYFWKPKYEPYFRSSDYFSGLDTNNLLIFGKMTHTYYKTQFRTGNTLFSSFLDIQHNDAKIEEKCSFHDMDDKSMISISYQLNYNDKDKIYFSTKMDYSNNIIPQSFWGLLSDPIQSELTHIRKCIKNNENKIINL
jgi:hypothetical protein